MRAYKEKETKEKELQKAVCNQCGRDLLVEEGILKEGCFSIDYSFDYFSEKDGYVYSFDLCESCFDRWMAGFQLPPRIEETKEFL